MGRSERKDPVDQKSKQSARATVNEKRVGDVSVTGEAQVPMHQISKKRKRRTKARTEVSSSSSSSESEGGSPPSQDQERGQRSATASTSSSESEDGIAQDIEEDSPVFPSKPKTLDPEVAFEDFYLRQATKEFANDLDKLRSANDFREGSVLLLVEGLKQGTACFGVEERTRIGSAISASAASPAISERS